MKSFLLVLTIGALLSFAACGGGGTGVIHPTPANYTISANVTGLNSGANVVLQDNGGNNLTVNADGTFSFTTLVPLGSPYSVSVLTQPTGQTCTPSNNTGTATSNVTVAVACASSSGTTYIISANVTGLNSGANVVLQDNGGNNLTVNARRNILVHNSRASAAVLTASRSLRSLRDKPAPQATTPAPRPRMSQSRCVRQQFRPNLYHQRLGHGTHLGVFGVARQRRRYADVHH